MPTRIDPPHAARRPNLRDMPDGPVDDAAAIGDDASAILSRLSMSAVFVGMGAVGLAAGLTIGINWYSERDGGGTDDERRGWDDSQSIAASTGVGFVAADFWRQ